MLCFVLALAAYNIMTRERERKKTCMPKDNGSVAAAAAAVALAIVVDAVSLLFFTSTTQLLSTLRSLA